MPIILVAHEALDLKVLAVQQFGGLSGLKQTGEIQRQGADTVAKPLIRHVPCGRL